MAGGGAGFLAPAFPVLGLDRCPVSIPIPIPIPTPKSVEPAGAGICFLHHTIWPVL